MFIRQVEPSNSIVKIEQYVTGELFNSLRIPRQSYEVGYFTECAQDDPDAVYYDARVTGFVLYSKTPVEIWISVDHDAKEIASTLGHELFHIAQSLHDPTAMRVWPHAMEAHCREWEAK